MNKINFVILRKMRIFAVWKNMLNKWKDTNNVLQTNYWQKNWRQ